MPGNNLRSSALAATAERFFTLSPAQRRVVHERLVERALARWKGYAEGQGEIHYVEGVVGTAQTVDASLPEEALHAVRSGDGIAEVEQRYGEPIAAMQDRDLTFPEPVTFGYYAIYNFFRKNAMQQEIDDWLLVSQAGSSEEDESKWNAELMGAIREATGRQG